MKKILVIMVHPRNNSFCSALAGSYVKGARSAGHEVRTLVLADMGLHRYLEFGHDGTPEPTEDLRKARNSILWADHLVFAYPTWWSGPPALLKIFLEIVLLPGFAYKYHRSRWIFPVWDRLLAGRSARVIATMDSQPWYHICFAGEPGFRMLRQTLDFCGVSPVRRNYFGSVRKSTPGMRERWLEEAFRIGVRE